MFTNLFGANVPLQELKHKEGDLFKVITAHGVTFEIYYGYYEEIDRQNPNMGPMEMYPNFIENPMYTADGVPFVTGFQKKCRYYKGEPDEDNTCYQCSYYERCEELLGVCRNKARHKKE